jgi:hypothetical protein
MKAKKCKSCGANLKGNKCEFCLTEYVFDTHKEAMPKANEPYPKVNIPETPKPVETNPRKTLGFCIAIVVVAAIVAGIIFLPNITFERSQIRSVSVILPEMPMSFTTRVVNHSEENQDEMIVVTEGTFTNIEYTLSYNHWYEKIQLYIYITGVKSYDRSWENFANVHVNIVSIDAEGRDLPLATRATVGRNVRTVDALHAFAGGGYAVGEEFTIQSPAIFLEYGETFRFYIMDTTE